MTVTDVDEDICKCASSTRYWHYEDEEVEDHIGIPSIYLVELDHITAWLCIECLIGLEEW